MTEFVIVALPLLFLGFAILEAGRWYVARQAVSYALFEAVRAGTVEGASREAIDRALERGLVPLLGDGATGLATGQEVVRRRLAQRAATWGMAPLKLEILSPLRADFDDFADPALRAGTGKGRRVINNDYQQERAGEMARRYRNGIGPRSGHTLFGANTLTIRISYLHEPMLPGLRAVVRGLSGAADPIDDYVGLARRRGLLAIVRQIAMPMQSHAVENE
jgi:hypothetical protein